VGRGNAQPLGRAHNYESEACSYSGLYQGQALSVTPRQLCYQHIPYFFLRISSKLGFTIINSIVDFVDSVENDSKKEGKEIKDAVRNLFSFWQAKFFVEVC